MEAISLHFFVFLYKKQAKEFWENKIKHYICSNKKKLILTMDNTLKDFALFARDRHVPTTTLEGYSNIITNSYMNPTVIEERRFNVAAMDVFSRLMMDRIIYLGMEINPDVANIINAQLLFLESTNHNDITLFINSPGGSVYDGLSIIDVMDYIDAPVSTTCVGMAASMGAVILSAGEKGKRSSLKHSKIMIHQPSSSTGHVQAADMKIAYEEMAKCEQTLYEMIAENTGKTFEEVKLACDRDNWLRPFEAKEFGLIDTILEKKKK